MCEEKDRAIKKYAQLANDLQGAQNFIALVGMFNQMMLELHKAGLTSSELKEHPITLATLDRLNSLAGISQYSVKVLNAHRRCEELASTKR